MNAQPLSDVVDRRSRLNAQLRRRDRSRSGNGSEAQGTALDVDVTSLLDVTLSSVVADGRYTCLLLTIYPLDSTAPADINEIVQGKMSTLEKPQLRGLHLASIKKNLTGILIVSFATALAFKVFVTDKRKQRYADFYKTYDPEKQLKIMNDAGLMQSNVPLQK